MFSLLFLKDFFISAWKVVFIIFLFNFFLISSVRADSHPIDDNDVLFLENLMLREAGLFTLLGSKPMTEFDVINQMEETEEEFAEVYQDLKHFLEEVRQKPNHPNAHTVLPSFEEFKEKRIALRNDYKFCDRKKIWDKWVSKRGYISTPSYKLVTRGKDERKLGLFINIAQTRYILKKYQAEFAQLVQIDFDPDTIIDSIGDEKSIFWEKVFKNHYLFGLLMGYGEKNSFLFDWVSRHSFPLESIAIHRFPELSRNNQHTREIFKIKVAVADLALPYFVSFEIDDKEIERYLKEREKIISFLKDKDLMAFVLNCLQVSR